MKQGWRPDCLGLAAGEMNLIMWKRLPWYYVKITAYSEPTQLIVKPCPQTLIPKTPRPNPQPSPTQFKNPISPKGTGADTKFMVKLTQNGI